MTGTTFSRQEWSKSPDNRESRPLTEKELLEEACWNGLFRELLPEIFYGSQDGKPIYLWNIREGRSFIELEMGDRPVKKEDYYSIDPYACMVTENFN